MIFSLPKKLSYSYSSIPTESQEELDQLPKNEAPTPLPYTLGSRSIHLIKMSTCYFLCFIVGFAMSNIFYNQTQKVEQPLELAVRPHLFEMERIYGDKPSPESDKAWDALMPKRGGFFNHPKIAPKRSAYAVFHQLHCLNALREAYWTALDAAASPTALVIDEIPFEIAPVHMRHCIDLLRQALMCTPDLTLELKNETLGGVTGFGTVHQCHDYSQLMDFVGEWEDVGAPVRKPGEEGNVHAHHHGHGS